jgi:hypothetical protein
MISPGGSVVNLMANRNPVRKNRGLMTCATTLVQAQNQLDALASTMAQALSTDHRRNPLSPPRRRTA